MRQGPADRRPQESVSSVSGRSLRNVNDTADGPQGKEDNRSTEREVSFPWKICPSGRDWWDVVSCSVVVGIGDGGNWGWGDWCRKG